MDELVIKYYRQLLKNGFKNAGSFENPSIFLDSVGEKIYICDQGVQNYLNIYIKVLNQRIEDIKYLCICNPTANVVAEILCELIQGKTIQDAETLTPTSFSVALGSTNEEFLKKSAGIIELLHRGINKYRNGYSSDNINHK